MLKPSHVKIITAAAIIFALGVAAFGAKAAEFGTVLTDLDGKPVSVDQKPDGAPMTLRYVATNALLAVFVDEKEPDENKARQEKLRRFRLAVRIQDAGDADLTLESPEIALIETLVCKMFVPLICGRAYDLLERKAK